MDKIKAGDDSSFTEDNLSTILREMFVKGAEAQLVLLRWAVRILSVHMEVLEEGAGRDRRRCRGQQGRLVER